MFPTGKTFEITVIDIMRFETGKLIEHWVYRINWLLWNNLG